MRLLAFLLCLGLMVACGTGKKNKRVDPATGASGRSAQDEYDYQTALQHFKVGVNYLNQGQIQSAIEYLENAVAIDGQNYRYKHSLGLAYSQNGELEKAIESLKGALEINPDDGVTQNLLGSIYIDMGLYDQAVAALKSAIQNKDYPHPQFPYFNMGLARKKQGRPTEALAFFNRAASIDPTFHRAYLHMADIYFAQKNYPKALTFYQKAERGFPDNVELLFSIGRTLFFLKRYPEAKTYLTQVSILFPPPQIDEPTQRMLRILEGREF